jgi:Protein of unknown function (DUF4011)
MPTDFDARIDSWRTQLLDTTKRNRLINFKSGRSGGVLLVHPNPGDLWSRLLTSDTALSFVWKRDLIDLSPAQKTVEEDESPALFDPTEATASDENPDILNRCLRSRRLRESHLLTDLPDDVLAKRLTRLDLNARESLTEQGVTILFAGFGFLRWFESPDSKVEIRSPLLLVPIRLERDTVESPWKLLGEDEEILPNHSLAQVMANDFRLPLPIPDDDSANAGDPAWRMQYLADVKAAVAQHKGWGIIDEAALGTFNFQKLAM